MSPSVIPITFVGIRAYPPRSRNGRSSWRDLRIMRPWPTRRTGGGRRVTKRTPLLGSRVPKSRVGESCAPPPRRDPVAGMGGSWRGRPMPCWQEGNIRPTADSGGWGKAVPTGAAKSLPSRCPVRNANSDRARSREVPDVAVAKRVVRAPRLAPGPAPSVVRPAAGGSARDHDPHGEPDALLEGAARRYSDASSECGFSKDPFGTSWSTSSARTTRRRSKVGTG